MNTFKLLKDFVLHMLVIKFMRAKHKSKMEKRHTQISLVFILYFSLLYHFHCCHSSCYNCHCNKCLCYCYCSCLCCWCICANEIVAFKWKLVNWQLDTLYIYYIDAGDKLLLLIQRETFNVRKWVSWDYDYYFLLLNLHRKIF